MPLFKPNIAGMKQKRDVVGLLEVIQSPDEPLRQQAAQAIRDIGAPALPALASILTNEHIGVRIQTEIANLLGSMRDESVTEILAQTLAMSRRREQATIEETTAAPNRTYRPEFYVNQIAASEAGLRGAVATAFGNIGSERAIEALFDMIASETGAMASTTHVVIKSAMSQALEQADEALIRKISDMLEHESVPARVMAVESLTQVGGEFAIAELLDIAGKENEEYAVRSTALSGLGKIADRRIILQLEALQYSGNRNLVRDVQGCLEAIRQRCPPPPIE